MQLLFALIEDIESTISEVEEEDLFHFIGDFIEEVSNIFVSIVVIQHPPQPLIYPEHVVVQIVIVLPIISIQLLPQLSQKGLIHEQVIHRVGNLLDIQVDVALKIFVSNRMHNSKSAISLLRQNYNQSVQILDQQRQLQSNDVHTQILLYLSGVV